MNKYKVHIAKPASLHCIVEVEAYDSTTAKFMATNGNGTLIQSYSENSAGQDPWRVLECTEIESNSEPGQVISLEAFKKRKEGNGRL